MKLFLAVSLFVGLLLPLISPAVAADLPHEVCSLECGDCLTTAALPGLPPPLCTVTRRFLPHEKATLDLFALTVERPPCLS